MNFTDDQPAVISPGINVVPKPKLNPPGDKFFGWVDFAGDENTFRFDEIAGAIRQPQLQGGKYIVIVKGVGTVPIPEADYYRLLKKCGWTEKSGIARVS